MKTLSIFLLLFVGCTTWQTIDFKSQEAITRNGVLFRDVVSLTNAKSVIPRPPYNANDYATIKADIASCMLVHTGVAKSGLSIDQLNQLSDAIELYRVHDSSGDVQAFFDISGQSLNNDVASIDTLESIKLVKP